MSDITQAKRLIAGSSLEGMRILGAGASKPCYQGRYNLAATAALEDPKAGLSPEERRLIASFIEGEGESAQGPRDDTVRFRVTGAERNILEDAASQAGVSLSDYLRQLAGLR